jgi:chromosome segregation ATPase
VTGGSPVIDDNAADPIAVRGELNRMARELDGLSRGLAETQRKLHPVKRKYNAFVANHKAGQWAAHVADPENVKMARQDIAEILAIQGMPLELRGECEELSDKAERLKKRISDLRAEVDAQRSILSALKTEMEAMG